MYLGAADIPRMADYLGLTPAEFELRHVYRTKKYARLRNPREKRCVFLSAEGCSVHSVKPTQCRTFPFWPEIVESKAEWLRTGSWCPGIGAGELIQITAIESAGRQMRAAYPHSYGAAAEAGVVEPLTLGPQAR